MADEFRGLTADASIDLQDGGGRVLAWVRILLNESIAIRDAKLIDVPGRKPLFAMPATPTRVRCSECGAKIAAGDRYCRFCGKPQPLGVSTTYHDSVFPVDEPTRTWLSNLVLDAYERKRRRVQTKSPETGA